MLNGRPGSSRLAAAVAAISLVLVGAASPAAAQEYTALLLPPPGDIPQNSYEYADAYAFNNKGQVFGRAGSRAPVIPPRPVLWTKGVPATLPVPGGYHWHDGLYVHFLNRGGAAVSTVQDNRNTTGDSSAMRPVIWQNGIASVIPLPVPGCEGYIPPPAPPEWTLSSWPRGLNASGHVLIEACNNFWIWDGAGGFVRLGQPDPVPGCLGLANAIQPGGNHLNDSDHVSLDRTWVIDTGGCPLPRVQPGIMTASAFTAYPASAGFAGAINNHDQMLLSATVLGAPHLNLATSPTTVVDLGNANMASLNNANHVAFMTAPAPQFPRLYRDGEILPLTFPPEAAGTLALLLNDYGQIAGTQPGFPTRAIILTPIVKIQSLDTPALLTGCKTGKGTVTLEYPAPASGITVSLSSTTAGATVPATLKFKAGVISKTFTITTTAVAALQLGNVTAALGTQSIANPLTLRPIGVLSLGITPNPVTGGATAHGTVTLECSAGPGDVTVSLFSSDPAVAAPTVPTLVVPMGGNTATFDIATASTTTTRKATITAAVPDALSKARTLKVTP